MKGGNTKECCCGISKCNNAPFNPDEIPEHELFDDPWKSIEVPAEEDIRLNAAADEMHQPC